MYSREISRVHSFITEVERVRYLPNGKQMKEADRYTIEELHVPSLELMERAAHFCVKTIYEKKWDLSRVCVVCGSGNNGGDGFAAARMLASAGAKVTAVLAGNPLHLTEESAYQKKLLEENGVRLSDDFEEGEYSIIVDAVFGVGLSRAVSGRYEEIIRRMNASSGRKLAVDIPSGISADTGMVLGTAFHADCTVTFQAEKLGILLYPGNEYAGEIITADIGISEKPIAENPEVAYAPKLSEYRSMLPVRRSDSHKGSYGRVLMIAGSRGMSGAAYLNALGAYRIGAGLVRLYTPEDNRVVLQQQLPEAVITPYTEYREEELRSLMDWADVVCIGSGIGRGKDAEQILLSVVQNCQAPCVMDADGLNILSEHKEYLKKLSPAEVIITPHMKEFARLTGKTTAEIQEDRADCLRAFVSEYGVTCVLKDARTLILTEGGHMCINLSGCAAMAKAGSGDVLAGIITGLLAQGLSGDEAAKLGAYVHGCAGEAAAGEKGRYSILARDIADCLGNVLKEWEVFEG